MMNTYGDCTRHALSGVRDETRGKPGGNTRTGDDRGTPLQPRTARRDVGLQPCQDSSTAAGRTGCIAVAGSWTIGGEADVHDLLSVPASVAARIHQRAERPTPQADEGGGRNPRRVVFLRDRNQRVATRSGYVFKCHTTGRFTNGRRRYLSTGAVDRSLHTRTDARWFAYVRARRCS